MIQLAERGEYYKMRCDCIEQRVQVAFFAHTSETAKAMTSQMRLFLARFRQFQFPVVWQFGGYTFELTANLNDVPATDELADLADRTNLTVLTWTLMLECQIPYLAAPQPYKLTDNGKHLKGYPSLERVHFDIGDNANILCGLVDDTPQQPGHGDWQ